jgi:hypothetical protein
MKPQKSSALVRRASLCWLVTELLLLEVLIARQIQAEVVLPEKSVSTDAIKLIFGRGKDSQMVTALSNLLTGSSWLQELINIKGVSD